MAALHCFIITDVWLLGYPVVYMFIKEHGVKAVRNISSKYLHIYRISVCSELQLKKLV
ncbi:uncharacterized protein Pyn_24327 [Prunus yedoensis var. nudiflora]|uniref:Uncharacterized protein n=1 Tax=Prunus yedoensis var. nudiflora TaxID=2094558 RepID=A0A314YGK6_PRUYE|nr:uncharacterized protein Pyn_24327 [Prunus yedoensis var. nudiflora]